MRSRYAARPSGGRRLFGLGAVVLGLGGTVACALAMILPIVGVVSSAASVGAQAAGGMAGMSGTGTAGGHAHYSAIEGFLLRYGKEILIASVLLVVGSFFARRVPRSTYAAVMGLVAGGVLYLGMYAQSSLALMYTAIAIGYASWAAAYVWVRRCPCLRAMPTGL